MRKLVAVVAVAALACGGSSGNGSSSNGSSNNGSSNGSSSSGGTTTPTGTVSGSSFLVTDAVASLQAAGLDTVPCSFTIPGYNTSLSVAMAALALDFSSGADACSNLTSQTCYTAATKSVRFVIAKVALGNQAQIAPITTGTYELMSDHAAVCNSLPLGAGLSGWSGTFTVAAGSSNDATDACHVTSSAASGTIQLTTITSTEVQGHVDVTFQDGGALKGDFTAALCPTALDVCKIAQSAMSDMDADHPLEICAGSSSGTTSSGSQYACK